MLLQRKPVVERRLNSLLRGEMAAVETYERAIEKLGGNGWGKQLRLLHDDHLEAADVLRQCIHRRGGEPAKGSGFWGAFAKTVTGTAKLLGDGVALRALKEGEEQGIFEYENALKDFDLPADCKRLIEDTLLPRTKEHIPILDRLMASS